MAGRSIVRNSYLRVGFICIYIFLFLLFACVPFKKPPPALIRVKKWPPLKRPADMKAFNAALARSLHYYSRLPADYTFWINNVSYTASELKRSLEILKYCLNQSDWQGCLKSHFDLYQAKGLNKAREVLFTGYYQPLLHGALSPSERYRYPIYRLPDEWVKIDLCRFNHNLPAKTLIGMVKGHEVVPFYTRAEIDFAHKLQGKGYELAWVDDPIELFFLHVQGSGILVLPDGQRRYVHYAASNGRPYRSIGRIMRKWGLLDKVNGLRIKEFLRSHPEIIQKIFAFNESYIFFKFVPKGPLGAINEVLVPYYSLATDPSVFPRGAILFVDAEIPMVDKKQHFLGWQPFKTLAFSQDTGGAIKGPGRADISFGSGPLAEAQACYMAQKGKLYLLVGKK